MPDTTIRIDKELTRLAKVEAATRGTSLKNLVEEAIRRELKRKK